MADAGPSGLPQAPSQPPRNGDAEPEGSGISGTAKTIVFVIAIQLFALAITKENAPIVQQSGYTYQPLGTSTGGSAANVLVLLFFVVAATLAAVWLVRRRRVKVFIAFVYIGTAVALFLLTLLGSISVTSSYMGAYDSLYLSLFFASLTIVALVLVSLHRAPGWVALVLTGVLSAEIGSYFASTIPVLTAILLPLFFAVYDIYTVFRGPLKTLVTALPVESLGAVSSKIGDFSIGTGDTVFYAMVPALAYYQFTISSAFVAIAAVDVGVVITLYLLSKAKLLPGLPIPMFLGVAAVLVYYFR